MKKLSSLLGFILLGGTLLSNPIGAVEKEKTNDQLLSMSLEELLQMKVSVASKSATSLREAPGVVTIMTREQISNSGAKDLLEILQLIPGVQFGVDVQGAVGIGIRGLWGHEGKVLLIWNGHELNELLYSTTQLGHHFPVDEIEKIEMIRGPGSVLYGGFAELAVVNIVTRGPKELKGGYLSGTFGQTSKTNSRLDLATAYGNTFLNDDLKLKASLYRGEGIRSDQTYTDLLGSSYNLKDDSDLDPTMLSFDVAYKDFDVRFLMDRYHTQQRDEFDAVLPSKEIEDFDSYHLLVQYPWKPSDSLTVTPRFSFKHQTPWKDTPIQADEVGLPFNRNVQRYSGYLTADYKPADHWRLLVGTEAYTDRAHDNVGAQTFSNGKTSISFWDFSTFGETEYKSPIATFLAGVRFDKHEVYGSSIVPRFSATKAFDRLHFKFLTSQAYRAPGIENISRNELAIDAGLDIEKIKAEKTTVFELESGYRLTDNLHLTANLFDMRIKDPIVYFFVAATEDSEYIEGYRNFKRIGSQGVEVDLRWVDNHWGNLNFNYAFYRGLSTDIDAYGTPGHSNYFIGLAGHKATVQSSLRITDEVRINPSLIVLGPRYGYATTDADGNALLERFGFEFQTNLNAIYRPKAVEGLGIQAGISNLLDEDVRFLQPYNGYHAPLPGLSREYTLKMTYDF